MGKFIQLESRMVVARGWGKGNRELVFNGHRVSVLQDDESSGIGCTITEMYLTLLNYTL